jgi:hypothetical protein
MKKIVTGFSSFMVALSMIVLPQAFVFADSNSINFESYSLGVVNGQDGWTSTGAAGSGCAQYDVAVSNNSYGYATFGTQSLRMSDAATSGCFGDQTFAKPLVNAAGEVDSTDSTFSRGALQSHFEVQFDMASTMPTEQPGMHTSFSPDRGDGSRMSYLRFEDGVTGIDVFFDDVEGVTNPANFVETQIAQGLSRSVPHTIKMSVDLYNGASNDVVKVWIDGIPKITGTTWENYYRYDSESSFEQSPRIIKTVLFRESGGANLADLGKGFVFDNLMLSSGPILLTPSTKDECKKDGWKTFNNPTFKNQGACVSFVEHL